MRASPYRVESDEWGNVVLLPLGDAEHSFRQSRIMVELGRLLKKGTTLTVFPLEAAKGVRILDAVWLSHTRCAQRRPVDDVAVLAPEICVEVAAHHNRPSEIDERMRLYFQHGATECWGCDVKGRMRFYEPAGNLPHSRLCPNFSANVIDFESDN